MYKFLNTVFFLLLLSVLVFNSKAQTYPFSNHTVENGLSQGQILSVFQDDDGVMWFGTSGGGITKYDGRSYEYITDKDGLADNVVFCIKKDKAGRILIATNNGLSVYDQKLSSKNKAKKFTNYTTKEGLCDNRIFTILIDDNGEAILGTAKGLSVYKDGVCSLLKIDKKLDSSGVFNLLRDSKKQLWFSTLGNGVFNVDGKKIKNYTTNDGLQNNMVFSVMETAFNSFWFFTGEGLCELRDGKIQKINPANIDTNATYYSFYRDNTNAIWLGTSNGLIKQNSNGSILVFKKKNGLVDNSIWKIFQDRDSDLWFASDQSGVSKLASERFLMYTTKDGLLFDEIKYIHQNKTGDYWIGSKLGICIYKNNEIINYNNKDLKGNADIWSIAEDKKGNYLVGTGNGLLIYNGNSFNRITCKDLDSPLNTIFDVFVDNKGVTWLGTPAGLAKIADGYIKALDGIAITKNYVNKIFQDSKGDYWFCTDDGLFKYNGLNLKHFSEKDGFAQKRVRNIIEDAAHNYWLATSSGVYKYNNNKFENITNTLNLASNEIYSIAQDKTGNIWAGLSNGLAKIELNNNGYKIRTYINEDGFIGQGCSQNAMLVDNKGRLVIGTSKGLMIYQAEYDRENNLEPATKLKSIDLFFQETSWDQYTDSINNNIPFNLDLPYDKNYLTFNFIGVSLIAPEKVSYKYMLKGIDKDWRISFKTEASYSNIPPGNYEFIVMANNGEGVWNKEPITFKFTINPPFWRTWWFYSLIAAIILMGIYSYFKIRTANIKILKQNEIIEEKNGALQHANNEIAEKNQNITDSINYAKRIQQSFLTSEKVIDQFLKEHFVLFKPRDIVSGDFYLAFDLPDRTVVVCADCTGHGIPGAFMSLIGISLLNEISRAKVILNASEILEELRNRIIAALNPDKLETGGKDGMDISLISVFKKTDGNKIKIHFSGANTAIQLVSGQGENARLVEYKGDKQPVGYYSNMKPFTQQEIVAQKGDIIYMYTDGYADQFGGLNGKKFMSKQLKHQIASVCHLPLKEQKTHLEKILTNWQGKLEQVDDVTIVGIKLS